MIVFFIIFINNNIFINMKYKLTINKLNIKMLSIHKCLSLSVRM